MKLQRILAKDSRSANEQAIAQYGRDVLIVSNSRVNGMTELIVAVDVEPDKMPPPQIKRGAGEPFEQALRQQMDRPASGPAGTAAAAAAATASMLPAADQAHPDGSAPEGFVPAHRALMQAAQRAAAQTLGQTEPLRPPATESRPATPIAVRYGHQFSLSTARAQPVLASYSLPGLGAAVLPPVAAEDSLTPSDSTMAQPAGSEHTISSDKAHALTDLIRDEIAQLRKEMRMGQQLQAWAAQGPAHRWNEALTDVGVPTALRALLMSGLSNDWDDQQALAAIEAQMAENLPAVPARGRKARGTKGSTGRAPISQLWSAGVHLLSGPSGSGKTSMAARLAHEAAQRLGVERVVLVSWNDNRPGAWGQLQLWASRIGVGAFRASDSATLDLLLQEHRGSLVIVDSGLTQPDILRAAVQGLNAQLHLVMPADANAATVRRWVGEQAPAWNDLIVTRLDESAQPWPLLQACCEHQIMPVLASDGSGLTQLRQPYDAHALLQHGMAVLAAVLSGTAIGEVGSTRAQAGVARLEIPTIEHITTTVPPRQAGRSGRGAGATSAASAKARTRQGSSHA